MEIKHAMPWLLPGVFVLIGIGVLLVRAVPEQLREKIHTNPGIALYRFRVFRYGVAAALFIVAAIAFYQTSP
jgi:hypothetical protein